MQRILKYELTLTASQLIDIQSVNILSTIEQSNNIAVYALVDPELPVVHYRFHIIGTGSTAKIRDQKYLGTVKLNQGQLVFHVYYKRENNVDREGV
jgi:hypothetical protein